MTILEDFDSSKLRLGTLCNRGHEYKDTGKTLRYKKHGGCPICAGVKNPGINCLTVEQRFWSYVDKNTHPNGCWLWTGAKSRNYGVLTLQPHASTYAHRFSWELVNSKIPKGLCALHRCDNPPCVNPNHLFIGTKIDNRQDCVNKGRIAKGEKTGTSKLKEWQVKEIRAMHSKGSLSHREIARLYNVSHPTIRQIIQRKTWAHV